MKNDLVSINPFPNTNIKELKVDRTNSVKLSDASIKLGPLNTDKISQSLQSLSEIKLEEISDNNGTYFSIFKKNEINIKKIVTEGCEILPTNLTTKEKDNSQCEKKIIDLKVCDSRLVCGNVHLNRTKSIKSEYFDESLVDGEEKLRILVKKSNKSCNTSRSLKSSKYEGNSKLMLPNYSNVIEIKNYKSYSNFELSKIIFDVKINK